MANESKPLTITRLIDAPVALVFKAWSDPELLAQWWGPGGFTAPTIKVDFRVGGKYLYCMQSPEGQQFWVTGIYKEIVPLKRIVWTDSFADAQGNVVSASHYGMPGDYPVEMQVIIEFEDLGNRTRLTLVHIGLPDAMDEMTGAGWTESLVKLESHVEGNVPGPHRKELVISRIFNAPRELVFKTMTEPEHLAHWWGPVGMKLEVLKMDLRPCGIFHYAMVALGKQPMYGKFVYREIKAPERMVFIVSFCDVKGRVLRHPASNTWPLEMLNIMQLEEKNGKTILTLRGWPIHETDEERATYEAGFASMNQGFHGTYDQLEKYLATLLK